MLGFSSKNNLINGASMLKQYLILDIIIWPQINYTNKNADFMIYQKNQLKNTQNQFLNAINQLQIGKLLRKCNITKNGGVLVYEVFQFLLLLVFQGKIYSVSWIPNHKDQSVPKNTYYCFLSETSYNWKNSWFSLRPRIQPRLINSQDWNVSMC